MRLRLPEQSSQRKQQSDRALFLLFGGFGNTVLGWRSNFSAVGASFSTGAGAGTLALNTGIRTRPLALLHLLLNGDGHRNTAVGNLAMLHNAGDIAGNGSFNDAIGALALNNNATGFSNNAGWRFRARTKYQCR